MARVMREQTRCRLHRGFLALCVMVAVKSAVAWEEPTSGQPALSPIPVLQLPVDTAAFEVAAASMQPASPPAASAPDAGMVAAGQSAFVRSCTTCHDEQRALQK